MVSGKTILSFYKKQCSDFQFPLTTESAEGAFLTSVPRETVIGFSDG